ncbi:speckle-type POZ protein-like [Cotesia glomerata]|uniref:speckle-type POZ protein-like n=1 Tax=Cotesia glomerata TaxID=32391 RepID=UPI001D030D2C|nr:speckle-type POZ protein-like [Cotesia glomerata]
MKKEKGYTSIEKHQIEYHWKINEISSYIKCYREKSEKHTKLFSPEFSTGFKMDDRWKLIINFNDYDSAEYKDWISLYLKPCNQQKKIEFKTNYTLFILDNKGVMVENNNIKYIFNDFNGYGCSGFCKKKELLENHDTHIPNDTLTVGIILTVFDSSTFCNSDTVDDEPRLLMIDDYTKLYEDENVLTDLVVKVKDETIKAHKTVLMARCPLFSKMFSITMENKQEEIDIPDVDSATFYSFLEFIYIEEVIDLDDYAEALFEFASKYKLEELKKMCVKALYKALNIDNASRLLILAKECDALELLDYISEFIVINSGQIIDTPEYRSIGESNPAIAIILLKKFAEWKLSGDLELRK